RTPSAARELDRSGRARVPRARLGAGGHPMPASELLEAMRTCRTVRYLRPDPVSDDLLRTVLTAATWAPSGGHRQPRRFLVVRDPARKRALRDLYQPVWERFAAAYEARMVAREPEARGRIERMMRAANHLASHLHEAPVIVVVCVRIGDLAITDAGLERP